MATSTSSTPSGTPQTVADRLTARPGTLVLGSLVVMGVVTAIVYSQHASRLWLVAAAAGVGAVVMTAIGRSPFGTAHAEANPTPKPKPEPEQEQEPEREPGQGAAPAL